jgi:hypothetical protein
LTVIVALRLTQYKAVTGTKISVESLGKTSGTQRELSLEEVYQGLAELAREGLVDWHGEDCIQITAEQLKRLSRFYDE